MLNHKTSRIIFIITELCLVITAIAGLISFWWMLLPAGVYIAILVYGSSNVNSGFFMKLHNHADFSTKAVALTFDDGPDEINTPKVLDILKLNNVKATFFCIGKKMQKHPAIVRRINEEGHIIGNHSYSHHFFFDLFGKNRLRNELAKTNEAGKIIFGSHMKLFRPPYGVTTPPLASAVKETGMNPVGWSLRTFDTNDKSENYLVEKINDKVKSGDIILLHDTMSKTAAQLQKIIDCIYSKNLQVKRLDELIQVHPYD